MSTVFTILLIQKSIAGCGDDSSSLEITTRSQGWVGGEETEGEGTVVGAGTNSLIWARVKYASGVFNWGRTMTHWKLLDNKGCDDFKNEFSDNFNAFDYIKNEDWISIDFFNAGNDFVMIGGVCVRGETSVAIFNFDARDDKDPCVWGNSFALDGYSYDSPRGNVCNLVRVYVANSYSGGRYIEEVDDDVPSESTAVWTPRFLGTFWANLW
eukprot:1109119_1